MVYIIVGDTDRHTGCLIYPLGSDYEEAKRILDRVLTNPTPNDLRVTEGVKNIRIEAEESENCWWNDPVLVN